MTALAALAAGLIFGLGLILSGMANPAKVQNFLDITGTWDPSLIFVMGGAIAVTLPAYALLRKRERPLLASAFHWPTSTTLDARLLGGSASFGVGWGLGGFCPGPVLATIPLLNAGTLVFALSMLIGLTAGNFLASSSQAIR